MSTSSTSLPEASLNASQVYTLLNLDDPEYGRIDGLSFTDQRIGQLTAEIVEVHVTVRKGRHFNAHHGVLWMNERGRIIASAIVTDGRKAVSYWHKPETLDRFAATPITTEHEYGLRSLGDSGAIPETRKFILENYNTEVAA